MKRSQSIEALIQKSRDAFAQLRRDYDSSLKAQVVGEGLKIDIKNIFENLRSCLDYLAHELFEGYCTPAKLPNRLYFPIRQTDAEFDKAILQDFPSLQTKCPAVLQYLRSLQPYNLPWLGQFNHLNNSNKHQDLVEQTRTESRQTTVSRPGVGAISWPSGVIYSKGISIMGVPIDPETQLPIPNNEVLTTVTIWIDFRFKDFNLPVLPFIEESIKRIENIYREISKYC